MLIPLYKIFNFAIELGPIREFPRPNIEYVIVTVLQSHWTVCVCRDILLSSPIENRRIVQLLQHIGVHCDLQHAHNTLMGSCVRRGHVLHATSQSCASFHQTSLQAIESIVILHVFQESARLFDSPDDSVLFSEDHLSHAFDYLFRLWICLETYVPNFRVPNSMPSYSLSRHRHEAQERLLCVILCLLCFSCDRNGFYLWDEQVTI